MSTHERFEFRATFHDGSRERRYCDRLEGWRIGEQGAQRTKVFDSQSTPSTSSKAPAAKTPAPGDLAKAGESESMESEATTGQPQSGGEIADALHGELMHPQAWPEPSATTSEPTTPAPSPNTPSEPTTTPSAECSSNSGFSIIKNMARDLSGITRAQADIDNYAERLASAIPRLINIWRSTTQAQQEPGAEEGKPT